MGLALISILKLKPPSPLLSVPSFLTKLSRDSSFLFLTGGAFSLEALIKLENEAHSLYQGPAKTSDAHQAAAERENTAAPRPLNVKPTSLGGSNLINRPFLSGKKKEFFKWKKKMNRNNEDLKSAAALTVQKKKKKDF